MNDFQKNLPKRLCLHCNKCEGKYPESLFSPIPKNCGFSGYIFLEQEKHKQKVRKLKEQIIGLKVQIINTEGNAKKKKYEKALEKIYSKLEELKQFGPIDF